MIIVTFIDNNGFAYFDEYPDMEEAKKGIQSSFEEGEINNIKIHVVSRTYDVKIKNIA